MIALGLPLALPFIVASCSSATSAWLDTATQTVRGSAGQAPTTSATLDPRLQYMRATVANTSFLLFKAATLDPVGNDPAVQVWYTPAGEVVRVREDGRLVGTAGVPQVDWREARLDHAPGWQQVAARQAAGQAPIQYTRVRDVAPGYYSGLQDLVTVQAVRAPSRAPKAMVGSTPGEVQWFTETSQLLDAARVRTTAEAPKLDPVHESLPPALYAVDMRTGQVTYSEQCLSASVCITLQAWPPSTPTAP